MARTGVILVILKVFFLFFLSKDLRLMNIPMGNLIGMDQIGDFQDSLGDYDFFQRGVLAG